MRHRGSLQTRRKCVGYEKEGRNVSSDFFRNQQYFKALTEASIVSKTDTDGVIVYVNDNFCHVTGYAQDELIGKTHAIFRHPDNPDALYKEMWDTIQSGQIWRRRMINIKKDGSDFVADTTIIPLIDEQGIIREYMAIRNDVTDMVQLEHEIGLQEQEKIKREKIAEAQKSFLLLFTHELKTPLNAIINFTKYIRNHIENPETFDREKIGKLLDSVLSNASDVLDNITMILETSKLNAHKLVYTYSLFSGNILINDTLAKFDSLIREKGIRVDLEMEPDVFIYSDEYRLKQIFANILSNAIKYGNDHIYISLQDGNGEVRLRVEDNGPGIKNKDTIFDLFMQEDENFLQRKGEGTGIGLYFIKLICKDLKIGYQIEDKKDGNGTVFTLILKNKARRSENGNHENTDR